MTKCNANWSKRSEAQTFKAIKQYCKYMSPVPSNTFHSPKQLPKRSWLTAPKSMVRDFNRLVIMAFLAHCIMKVRELVVESQNQSFNSSSGSTKWKCSSPSSWDCITSISSWKLADLPSKESMKDTTPTVLKEENDQTKEIFRFTRSVRIYAYSYLRTYSTYTYSIWCMNQEKLLHFYGNML